MKNIEMKIIGLYDFADQAEELGNEALADDMRIKLDKLMIDLNNKKGSEMKEELRPGKGKLAIISMSGGLDSATLCAKALYEGYDIFILNFNYNQKNAVEMKAFDNLIDFYKREYISYGRIIGVKKLNLKPIFNEFLDIWAEMRDNGEMKEESKHEFYTPSRNLLFAVISAVIGEIIALSKNYDEVNIGLGIHKHSTEAYGEHKDYWDITPEFAKRLQDLFSLNDVKNIKIYAPFAEDYKYKIVEAAKELKVPFNLTWTCYNPQKVGADLFVPCGECEACVERQLAGEKAGVPKINEYYITKEFK